MLEDPRGLASLPRLSSTYSSLSHDFYESLNEFLALEDDRSAMAVRAHAKTTAKATAQAGAAALSAAKSRLGAGISIFGKKLNAQFGKSLEELSSAVICDTGAPPAPPPPPADAAPPAMGGAEGRSFSASTDDAASSAGDSQGTPSSMAELRSGSATLHDTQAAVLRHQLGLLKTRHTFQARLLETRRAARIALARTLVDYFYANFASTPAQVTRVFWCAPGLPRREMEVVGVAVKDDAGFGTPRPLLRMQCSGACPKKKRPTSFSTSTSMLAALT
jgi:hypothetical protein